MNPTEINLVQETWQKIKPIAPKAAEIFYQTLFELDPALKPLFKSDINEQGNKLMVMLDTAVKLLNSPEQLVPAVQKLGQRHIAYDVHPQHYDTVGAALLKTLEVGLADAFTSEVKQAWTEVYQLLAETMIEAANALGKNNSTGTNNMMSATILD